LYWFTLIFHRTRPPGMTAPVFELKVLKISREAVFTGQTRFSGEIEKEN
jgi:hypothetical protein